MSFDWKLASEGLLLREDAFSWQGAFKDDKRFFLRRSKDVPEEITDVLIGSVDEVRASNLLGAFLRATGGVSTPLIGGRRLIFRNVSTCDDPDDKRDQLETIIQAACMSLDQGYAKTKFCADGTNLTLVFELDRN